MMNILGVVVIISIMTNPDQLKEAVEKVCLIQVTPLTNIMNHITPGTEMPKIVKHSVSDPALYLDRLSAVFRHIQAMMSKLSKLPFIICQYCFKCLKESEFWLV